MVEMIHLRLTGVYCYDWAVCTVRRLVIRADLAENDNTLKHNDRPRDSKGGGGAKERELESRKRCAIHSCAV